jgi:hypothetical protein
VTLTSDSDAAMMITDAVHPQAKKPRGKFDLCKM